LKGRKPAKDKVSRSLQESKTTELKAPVNNM